MVFDIYVLANINFMRKYKEKILKSEKFTKFTLNYQKNVVLNALWCPAVDSTILPSAQLSVKIDPLSNKYLQQVTQDATAASLASPCLC